MGASQLIWGAMFISIAYAVFTRARWLPRIMGKLPGGTRAQNVIARVGGLEVAVLQGELEMGNPTNFFMAIAAARDGQWAKRAFLCEKLACSIPGPTFDAWIATNPDQQLLQLLLGFRKVRWAWEARGHGNASTVSDDSSAKMGQLGAEAAEAFARASAVDPRDPTPWIGRIDAERLIQADDVTTRARAHFAEAMRRDPENGDAIRMWLSVLAPYWWGKNGEGLVEARAVAAGAPPGSVRPTAIFEAHHNEWHKKRHWGSPEEAAAYFQNPAVIAELRAAHAGSLGSPAFRPGFNAYALYNDAAFCLFLAGQKDLVQYELARIGERYSDIWQHLPGIQGPRAGYAAAEAWARS